MNLRISESLQAAHHVPVIQTLRDPQVHLQQQQSSQRTPPVVQSGYPPSVLPHNYIPGASYPSASLWLHQCRRPWSASTWTPDWSVSSTPSDQSRPVYNIPASVTAVTRGLSAPRRPVPPRRGEHRVEAAHHVHGEPAQPVPAVSSWSPGTGWPRPCDGSVSVSTSPWSSWSSSGLASVSDQLLPRGHWRPGCDLW